MYTNGNAVIKLLLLLLVPNQKTPTEISNDSANSVDLNRTQLNPIELNRTQSNSIELNQTQSNVRLGSIGQFFCESSIAFDYRTQSNPIA